MDEGMDEGILAHLLANPNHMKKNQSKNYNYQLHNDLMVTLTKIFPEYELNDHDHDIILKKIEKLCKDLFIEKTVNNIVDTIISDIILDYEQV